MLANAYSLNKARQHWRTPKGEIIYAIGDIHGRDDLLDALLRQIYQDISTYRADKIVTLVFLGDYVDRGLGSRAVIERLWRQQKEGDTVGVVNRFIHLRGNHEDMLLRYIENPVFGEGWLMNGGTETLISYGVDAPISFRNHAEQNITAESLKAALGVGHFAFLRSLPTHAIIGDYAFVHAGFRPGIPIDAQSRNDMLWIRQSFLKDEDAMDKRVVHGHSPDTNPFVDHRRIGVDTGAFFTGILTAVRLEDDTVKFLQTEEGLHPVHMSI